MPVAPVYINIIYSDSPDDLLVITPILDTLEWIVDYRQNRLKRYTQHTLKYSEIKDYLSKFLEFGALDHPTHQPKWLQIDIPGFPIVQIDYKCWKSNFATLLETLYSHRSAWPQEPQVSAPDVGAAPKAPA